MSKWDKIQNALKNAQSINQVYEILEQFRLTSSEECQIAQTWAREQAMLKDHGMGVFAEVA